MKKGILCLLLALQSGCSNLILKRCESPAVDFDLWSCPEHVTGKYRMCQKPMDTFRCEAPQ